VRCARWQEAARRNKSVNERISCVRKHNSNANFGSNDGPRRNGHGRRKTKDWSINLFLWEVEMQTNWVSKLPALTESVWRQLRAIRVQLAGHQTSRAENLDRNMEE